MDLLQDSELAMKKGQIVRVKDSKLYLFLFYFLFLFSFLFIFLFLNLELGISVMLYNVTWYHIFVTYYTERSRTFQNNDIIQYIYYMLIYIVFRVG